MISLWLFRVDEVLDGAGDIEPALRQLLAAEDREKLAGYRDRRARLHYFAGRALLRHALSQTAEVEPHAWRLRYGEHGKPELAPPFDRTRLFFSISHCGGLVVCAVAMGRKVGVDVEWLGRRVDEGGIARRFFSPQEVRDIEERSGIERARRFFALWTLREAYVKARGEGLSYPLERLACDLSGAAPQLADCSLRDTEPGWYFSLSEPFADYCVALCAEQGHGERNREPLIGSQMVTLDISEAPRLSASDAAYFPWKFL